MTMADNSHQDRELSLGALEPHHAHAVHSLFLKVKRCTPYGFLADRGIDEFKAILSDSSESVSVGAWAEGRLVAYCLGRLESGNTHPGSALIRHLHCQGEKLCAGKGALVDPEYRGRKLMRRLLSARLETMRMKGLPHLTGLVAVDNLASIVGLLKAGSWMVSIERDEYCMNFVQYSGEYCSTLETLDETTLAFDDLKALQVKFDTGWVATRLQKSGPTHEFILHRIPALGAA